MPKSKAGTRDQRCIPFGHFIEHLACGGSTVVEQHRRGTSRRGGGSGRRRRPFRRNLLGDGGGDMAGDEIRRRGLRVRDLHGDEGRVGGFHGREEWRGRWTRARSGGAMAVEEGVERERSHGNFPRTKSHSG